MEAPAHAPLTTPPHEETTMNSGATVSGELIKIYRNYPVWWKLSYVGVWGAFGPPPYHLNPAISIIILPILFSPLIIKVLISRVPPRSDEALDTPVLYSKYLS